MRRHLSVALMILLACGAGAALSQSAEFWTDPSRILLLGVERLSVGDFREGLPALNTAARADSPRAVAWLAHAYHLQRRLTEASEQYAQLLRLEPSREPNPAEREAILRFAPRIFQVRSDPFPLRDAVAIHHPEEPLIAYHLFWEDDIDFPEDNDPCDHELVWVRYDPTTMQIVRFTTYFHGRMLEPPAAIDEARRNNNRPRLNVQWGKHGSLPYGWETLSIQADIGDIEREYLDIRNPVSMKDYNVATWQKLRNVGRRLVNHALGESWPARFEGTWENFVAFDREVDLRALLQQRRTIAVSRWNNATLQQRFLRYNFRPKTEWPDREGTAPGFEPQLDRRVGASLDRVSDPTEWIALRRSAGEPEERLIDRERATVDLPPMSLWRPETPRYPNLWFYAPVTDFPTYAAFVDHLSSVLRGGGYAADEVSLNEGADLALSIEHLQPWSRIPPLMHAHAIHVRLFWKRLERDNLQRTAWGPDRTPHWQVAASVHYEVEHANDLHADVVICPICGRTGVYADKPRNLVEDVHDPLGLELLVWGTVRGGKIGTEFGRLPRAQVTRIQAIEPFREDMNTETIVLLTLKRG